MPGPFSLTIQPRKQKALGTRLDFLQIYFIFQEIFHDMTQAISKISFVRGFPENVYDILEGYENSLAIIDDFMSSVQNLFPPGKQSRTISLNSHCMIVFKNTRDSLGIATLARQMHQRNANYLPESFDDATSKRFGYILFDMHPTTAENLRLRTNILPHER